MKPIQRTAALFLCALMLMPAALAGGPYAEYCFARSDFVEGTANIDGIFLTQVPGASQGEVLLGDRTLRAGDAVSVEDLDRLVLQPADNSSGSATLVFHTVEDGHAAGLTELKLSLASKKDQSPTAKDSSLETYKNIPNSGTLTAEDPEGGPLSFTLVKAPKRGTVELREDGTFTYTPNKNKVGKDSFTFTAADRAGNVSQEAKVSIEIIKPTDRMTYADMSGQEGEFLAIWMKEQELLLGETVAGHLCFHPDAPVSRGDFLAMTMKLLEMEPAKALLTSGFADEAKTPGWLQPYVTAALRSGMITGVSSETGLVFRPDLSVTKAEAAVMLQNALRLPLDGDTAVFAADSTVPAWAENAYRALSCAGLDLSPALSAENLTRKEAAALLYRVAKLLEEGTGQTN